MAKKTIEKPVPANVFIKIVDADSLQDAAKKAPFYLTKIVTSAWVKSGRPTENRAVYDFCIKYLRDNTSFEEDFGFAVVMESVRSDKRVEVYKSSTIEKKGSCRRKRTEAEKMYVFRDDDGHEVKTMLGTSEFRHVKAEMKRLMKSLEYKGTILRCYVEYRFADSGLVLEAVRHPKKQLKQGKYLLFGVSSIR